MLQADVGGPEQVSVNQVLHLIDLCRAMFTGGEPGSGPVRSGVDGRVSEASDGLIVDAMAAIKEVMKPCTKKGRRLCGPECAVHQQCVQLDKEEMLGYMLGDRFGLPRIPQPYARSVGETARLRGVKVAPAIDACERRLRKASSSAAPALADALHRLRANVAVTLEFPSRQLCVAHSERPPSEPVDPVLEAEAAWRSAQAVLKQAQKEQQAAAAAIERAKAAWDRRSSVDAPAPSEEL